jgi:sirohydrochlorin ferrochelatase
MTEPSLLLIGHGSRSVRGVDEYWRFTEVLRAEAPDIPMEFGFIELVEPDLDTAVDRLVGAGARNVVGVPLVLLGAGHMKNDGPACMTRARRRHPGTEFTYGTELGIHPLALDVATERMHEALGDADPATTAVLLVGRGSSDPDANADLAKVARLLWDGRGFGWVEPAYISLARPSVPEGLERCRRLGAERILVVPYFLFTGILVDRIHAQAAEWATAHPDVEVVSGSHLGTDRRLAQLVLERFRQAAAGETQASCDCCVYRVALPGHETKVGLAVRSHHDAEHDHDHGHSHGARLPERRPVPVSPSTDGGR